MIVLALCLASAILSLSAAFRSGVEEAGNRTLLAIHLPFP